MKQKTEDYKLSAVTYYNNNDDGYDKTMDTSTQNKKIS